MNIVKLGNIYAAVRLFHDSDAYGAWPRKFDLELLTVLKEYKLKGEFTGGLDFAEKCLEKAGYNIKKD